MDCATVGLLAIGSMITVVVVVGVTAGHDGYLLMGGIGALTGIFGMFIEKLRQQMGKGETRRWRWA